MLNVPLTRQCNPQGRNSCVPACLSMTLAYQGVTLNEQELCDLLDTQLAGTPIWNVLTLQQHVSNCRVEIDSASLARLQESLTSDVPPIAFVATRRLNYWQRDTIHAVVVVSVDEDHVHVNDPAFPTAPLAIPCLEFLAAWGELDFLTAIVEVGARR